MDNSMAGSRERIKALREARAWSQAHLAEAASFSVRTVQRVEAEGTASAETRLAIAAALDVPVDSLNVQGAVEPAVAERATRAAPGRRARIDPGPWNTLAMFVAVGAAELFTLTQGSRLPARVATHFGVAGDANASMTRDGFVAWMSIFVVALPLLSWAFLGWAMRRDRLNIPNAAWWLAEPRRPQTVAWLLRHVTCFCVALTAFVAYTFWLVVAANVAAPAHPALDNTATSVGMGVFLAVAAAWVTTLGLHFRREPA